MLPRRQPSTAFFWSVWSLLTLLASVAVANTEKTIFLGPPSDDQSTSPSSLRSFLPSLHRLDPGNGPLSWRTNLQRTFPWAPNATDRSTTWVLLDNLTAGQRYELRVCWAATQPTEFDLETFTLDAVQSTPELAAAVESFAAAHGDSKQIDSSTLSSSTLLLRIIAYADYVASDRSLMNPDRVPPVLTDVILDPYLGNAVPQSLLPTISLIVVVAGVSAVLAKEILKHLRCVLATVDSKKTQ